MTEMRFTLPEFVTPGDICKIDNMLIKNGIVVKKYHHAFEDATAMAVLLKQLYPRKVELHNYSPCSALATKKTNWATLNNKVLKKINMELSPSQIDMLARGKPGEIEKVLLLLWMKQGPNEQTKTMVDNYRFER